jgi:hypothetical protein
LTRIAPKPRVRGFSAQGANVKPKLFQQLTFTPVGAPEVDAVVVTPLKDGRFAVESVSTVAGTHNTAIFENVITALATAALRVDQATLRETRAIGWRMEVSAPIGGLEP